MQSDADVLPGASLLGRRSSRPCFESCSRGGSRRGVGRQRCSSRNASFFFSLCPYLFPPRIRLSFCSFFFFPPHNAARRRSVTLCNTHTHRSTGFQNLQATAPISDVDTYGALRRTHAIRTSSPRQPCDPIIEAPRSFVRLYLVRHLLLFFSSSSGVCPHAVLLKDDKFVRRRLATAERVNVSSTHPLLHFSMFVFENTRSYFPCYSDPK